MSVTITERPHTINFSKNEVRYVCMVSDPDTAGVAVDFELYQLPMGESGEGSLVTGFSLRPNSDGSIYCDLQDYLNGLVALQLPALEGDLIQPLQQQGTRFYIKYRQVSTAEPNTTYTSDIDELRTLIFGGVEQIKFKRNNFFTYQAANKMFMTWQPSGRYVFTDQPTYLTFLLTAAREALVVQYTVLYADSSSDTKTVTYSLTGNPHIVFSIQTGVQANELHLLQPDKTIYYYQVRVLAEDETTVLANYYRYYIDYVHLYSFFDFHFFNSLGGLDPVRVKGRTANSVEVNSEATAQVIYKEDYTSDRPQPQFGQSGIFKRDNYKGDIGWSRTREEQEALLELLMSRGIYEVLDERWIRIIQLKKSADLASSRDKKYPFAVEWNYGYEEQVFTPKNVVLGRQTAYVPPCYAVEIPAINLPDGQVGEVYAYNMQLTGSTPFAIDDITKPGWMTIELSGSMIIFGGTPDTDDTDIEVSFTISNCASDTADFSDTIDITPVDVLMPSISIVSNNASGGIRTQIFAIDANVTDGNKFYVVVYSHVVEVVASSDTPASIATKLATAVNAESESDWNEFGSAPASGTPGFKPTAYVSGNQLTLVLNTGNQFAAGATIS